MSEVQIEGKSGDTNGKRSKNSEWKSKAAAPGPWVTALLRGKTDGSTVLIEFRSGRKGVPMVADALPFNTMDGDSALLSVAPLASECWEIALNHRQELEGDRYDYRVRVVTDLGDGAELSVIIESEWIELGADDATGSISMDFKGADPMAQLLSQMVLKLFSANIQLTRASGNLVRQVTEGMAAGVDSQFSSVEKVKLMAQELIEAKAEVAKEQGDAEEIKEMGKTARKWIGMSHESKLAKQGVRTPPVPTSRREAAISLYNSLTVKQLTVLKDSLGPDKAELLLGLMDGAEKLNEQQVEQVFAEQLGQLGDDLELVTVAEKVFNANYVPSTWAIWQTKTAHVLINGVDDADD